MSERIYRSIDPRTVVVACMPNHTPDPMHGSIWTRRFIGVKAGENADGMIRVKVYGTAEDLKRSVFTKARHPRPQMRLCADE